MTVSRIRWVAKKAARKLASVLPDTPSPGLRALTYHGFSIENRDPFSVNPAAFESQIAAIARDRLALSPDEVAQFVDGRAFPGRILITIDDGVGSVHSTALPVLQRYGVGAILFVVVDWVGQPGHMNEANIRAASDAGIVIGSHSHTHPVIAKMSIAEQVREIAHSRAALAVIVRRPVRAFAYPYGTRFSFNAETRQLVKDAGYSVAFTTQHGAITAAEDRYELPRIKVEGGDDPSLFDALCRGAMDKWRFVDRGLSAFQRPETGRSPQIV